MTDMDNGYYCVVCGRFLTADERGVIVHDDVPHTIDMDFGDEEKPRCSGIPSITSK